jgi:hypothetical protein
MRVSSRTLAMLMLNAQLKKQKFLVSAIKDLLATVKHAPLPWQMSLGAFRYLSVKMTRSLWA